MPGTDSLKGGERISYKIDLYSEYSGKLVISGNVDLKGYFFPMLFCVKRLIKIANKCHQCSELEN
jgi:hypothetical protein